MQPPAMRLSIVISSFAGDLGVLAVVEHAQLHGAPLPVPERVERRAQIAVELVEPRLVGSRRCLAGQLDPEALARPPLERATPHRVREHVAGDPEQPWCGAAARPVPEAPAGEPGRREGLGGQLERGLLVAGPPGEEALDPLRVTVVERPKRFGAAARAAKQLGVGRRLHLPSLSRRPPPALPAAASLPRWRPRSPST
jgi:hypothetical protein